VRDFWRRRSGFGLEDELRALRSEPRAEFVTMLAQRVREDRRASFHFLSRVSFAGAVTVFMLGTLAAFGGLGYAASTAGQTLQTAGNVASSDRQESLPLATGTSGQQSGHGGQVTPPQGERIAVETQRIERAAAAPVPLEQAQQREELPFTGLALGSVILFALGLVALGAWLRRAARRGVDPK
jgi:hypothetical protein